METKEITASDLLHIPHMVIIEKTNGLEIVEFEKSSSEESPGVRAHKYAMNTTNNKDAKKIIVAVRIRTLEKG